MQFKSLIKLCHGGTVNAVYKTVIFHEYCHLMFIYVCYNTEDSLIFTVIRMKPPPPFYDALYCYAAPFEILLWNSIHSPKMYFHACFKIFCYHHYVWNFITSLCFPVYQISLLYGLPVKVLWAHPNAYVLPYLKFGTNRPIVMWCDMNVWHWWAPQWMPLTPLIFWDKVPVKGLYAPDISKQHGGVIVKGHHWYFDPWRWDPHNVSKRQAPIAQ